MHKGHKNSKKIKQIFVKEIHMKALKKIAGICLALTLCFGIGALTACNDNAGNTSSITSEQPTGASGYKFKVLNADGTPAVGYQVQLCILNSKGEQTACYMPIAVGENGQVTYAPQGFPGAGTYNIHVLDAKNAQVEFEGAEKTPTEYNTEDIVLTLK